MEENNNELIRLAVIDDGINEKLYDNIFLDKNIEINSDLIVSQRIDYDSTNISHGTTCAAIIKKYSSCNIFTSIKILGDKGRGSKAQLIKAIEWCIKNNISIINLSLGSIDYRDHLDIKNIINCAYNKGIIIVAACSNKGIFTYPASLSNVIGVKCDKEDRLKFNEYIYNVYAMDGIEITANSKHYLIDFMGNRSKTFQANSFAGPVITALVHDMMTKSPNLKIEDIKEKLLYKSKVKVKNKIHLNICKNIDWVKKSVIFIINSEIESYDLKSCCIEIYDIIHIHCSCVSKGFKEIYQYIIRNKSVFYVIDTMTIIDRNGVGNINNEEAFYIEKISKYIKNVIYISNNHKYINPALLSLNMMNKIWHPIVYKYYNGGIKMKRGTKGVEVPIVIVYNFIGKELNSIVYDLLEEFRKDGYSVVSVSDTPIGILYRCEFVPVCDNVNNFGDIDLNCLKIFEKIYNPDIIMCGIDATNVDKAKLLNLMKSKQADINVIITDKYTSYVDHSNKANKNNTEVVVLSKEINCDKLKLDITMFNYLDKKLVSKLYNYMIFCLQKK